MVQLNKVPKVSNRNTAVRVFSIAAFLVLVISVYTIMLLNSLSANLQDIMEERLKYAGREAARLISPAELAELLVPEDMQ
jgi:hypothetical protein